MLGRAAAEADLQHLAAAALELEPARRRAERGQRVQAAPAGSTSRSPSSGSIGLSETAGMPEEESVPELVAVPIFGVPIFAVPTTFASGFTSTRAIDGFEVPVFAARACSTAARAAARAASRAAVSSPCGGGLGIGSGGARRGAAASSVSSGNSGSARNVFPSIATSHFSLMIPRSRSSASRLYGPQVRPCSLRTQ